MKNTNVYISQNLILHVDSLIRGKSNFNRIKDQNFTNRFYSKLQKVTEVHKKRILQRAIELYIFIQDKNEDPNFFTNIHTNKLKRFDLLCKFNRRTIAFTYKDFINLLYEVDILLINNIYSHGNFSKSYRLNKHFDHGNFSKTEVNISKIFNTHIRDKQHWVNEYPELYSHINVMYETNIDISAYHQYLTENIEMSLSPVYKKSSGRLHNRYLSQDRVARYLIQAIKYNLGYHWITMSNEGRVYSSFTNMSAICDNFIYHKGKRLVNIDVINAQPVLLAVIVNNKEFKEAVERGIFYDIIATELGKTRTEIKLMVYKYVLFGKKQLKSGKMFNALQKYFPGLIHEINDIKKDRELYSILQRMESDIFIKSTLNEKKPFLTKHDAIYCYEEDVEQFKSNILLSFVHKHNVSVNFKVN